MKKRKIATFLVFLLYTLLLSECEGAASTTSTDDAVLSGSSATLTCTIDADGGTIILVQWQDSDDNNLSDGSDGYTITTTTGELPWLHHHHKVLWCGQRMI